MVIPKVLISSGATFNTCSFIRNCVDDGIVLFEGWVRKLKCCDNHLARLYVRVSHSATIGLRGTFILFILGGP